MITNLHHNSSDSRLLLDSVGLRPQDNFRRHTQASPQSLLELYRLYKQVLAVRDDFCILNHLQGNSHLIAPPKSVGLGPLQRNLLLIQRKPKGGEASMRRPSFFPPSDYLLVRLCILMADF